jgi:hypothetical protein
MQKPQHEGLHTMTKRNIFSSENIAAAVERLTLQSSKEIQTVMARAKNNGITELHEACMKELSLRGATDLSA